MGHRAVYVLRLKIILPDKASFEHTALNRITFGARQEDVQLVQGMGWRAWAEDQLSPPTGDEAEVANHLSKRTMRIMYAYQGPAGDSPGWPGIDERRPLNYLNADVQSLWEMVSKTEITIAPNERKRIQEELSAATWIRNTHATFQVREFMADFWNNHFNVGRQDDIYGSAALPTFDRSVIRSRVFGNFRDLLEAVATSTAMLRYLDNAASTAEHPNENYARELLELHTMGIQAYLGVRPNQFDKSPDGFTDDDIVQASRAFSGWTVAQGQQGPQGPLPFSGAFFYNPLQHNDLADQFMGIDLSKIKGSMAQGRAILDIAASHPSTADFVCVKLCRRIFGDDPPPRVIDRAKAAWMTHLTAPDQIGQVLRAILLDGTEIGQSPSKLRRPYERVIALLRTTNTEVNAYNGAFDAVSTLGDGLFAWPTPEGRPDHDAHWYSTAAHLETWDLMLHVLSHASFRTTLTKQTPKDITTSPEALVDYWVDRLVGYRLRPEGMQALIDDINGPIGLTAAFASGGIMNMESALRRFMAIIAASPEFAMR